MQLKKLDKLKEQYSYHENINALQKDLHKVYRCIKNGGNLSDIQKICIHNYTAYLKISVPYGMGLKEYTKTISNDIESATDVNKHVVYVDYLYTKCIYV